MNPPPPALTPLSSPAPATHIEPADTRVRVALVALLLLAFALRAWRLDFQSFWSDEGLSLNRATLPLAEMLARMPAEHVPGYFVALRGWLLLTGTHDYGLRAFSMLPSVLAVALTFRLAADATRPAPARLAVGTAAALLVAVHPFLIWYAQETRMYAWLLAAALASTVALWRVLHARSQGERMLAAAAYALTTAATVYLHYFGTLVPIAHMVYMAGYVPLHVLAGARGRALWVGPLAWMAGSAGALLLFASWLPRVRDLFAFTGWRDGGSVAEIPWRYLQAYSGGALVPWLPWMMLALAVWGAVWWLRVRPAGAALLLTWLLAPAAGVLLLAARNPDYHERYTVYLAAPLLLLAAAGIVALAPNAWTAARRHPLALLPAAAALALVAAMLLQSTWRQATDTALHKPDFRSAAALIQANEKPGDVILVDGPNPDIVFNHYYTGALPVIDLRDLDGADWETVSARLAAETAGAQRGWEVLYFHEPAAVQMWLATQGWTSEPTGHNGIRVTLYALRPPGTEPVRHDLAVGGPDGALLLEQSAVGPSPVSPGTLLQVTTDWFTRAPAPEYKFSLRLMDAAGAVALAQDYVPQNWFAPTTNWVVGQPARDTRAFLIPEALASGTYSVTLRLYDPATGAPAPTAAGDDIPLGTVEVAP